MMPFRLRRKAAVISLYVLEEMLHGRLRPAKSSLPDDLVVVGVLQTPEDRLTQRARILCESGSFDPLVEGGMVPDFDVTFEVLPS